MKEIFRLAVMLFVLTIFNGCTGVVGNNVKLENLPPKVSIENVNFKMYVDTIDRNVNEYGGIEKRKSEKVATEDEMDDLQRSVDFRKGLIGYPKSGCFANIWTTSKEVFKGDGVFGEVYLFISFWGTLTIIPYVHPTVNKVKATLVDVNSAKILKEYELKERSYYILSINPFVWLFSLGHDGHGGSERSEEIVKGMAQKKLIEAMIRIVTNDVYNFPECRKK